MQNRIVIVVGTNNDVKVACVQEAAKKVFKKTSISVIKYNASSGVPEQPLGLSEILCGARNRIIESKKTYPHVTYYVAIESGIIYINELNQHFDTSVTLITSYCGKEATAWSTMFLVIPPIMALINAGRTLGKASDLYYGTSDIGNKEGYSGVLTGGLVSRKTLHLQPTIFAFKTLETLTL